MKHYLYSFVILTLAAGAAIAEPTVQKLPLKQISNLPLDGLDIGGLKAGMTPEVALKTLKDADDRYKIESETVSLGGIIKGARIATSDFTERASAHIKGDNSDLIYLNFSSPASGNQLVSLTRSFGFYDAATAPTLDQLGKSLTEKYGRNSYAFESGSSFTVNWVFKDGKTVDCPKPSEDQSHPCYRRYSGHKYSASNPESSANLEDNLDALLSVDFKPGHSKGQIEFMMMTYTDYKRAKANGIADIKGLEAIADEVGPAKKAAPRL